MFIAKYDKQSHLVFAFKLSGLSGYDNITAITTDKDDNVYVTGYFANTVDFDPGSGTAVLSTGNYYVYNLFFAKYDKNGNYIFAKPIVSPETKIPGEFTAIIVDSSSNIFVAGNGKPQDLDFDPSSKIVHPESHGKYDAFFAKYNSSGEFVFVKAVGSSDDDFCNGITLNKNHDVIISGSFTNSVNDFDPTAGKVVLPYKGGSDAFIGIYDSLGNYYYAFSFGGIKADAGYGIATDQSNDIIVSGSFYGTIDFAPDSSVIQKSSDLNNDYFIAKYTQNAKLLFVTTIHTDSQVFTPLVVDSLNNIYIGGGFIKSVSFTTDSFTSKGGYDAFVAKYNPAGIYNSSNQISGSSNEIINDLVLKNNNQICITGNFSDTCFLNSDNTKKLVTQNPNSFIAIYNTSKVNNISANAFETYRKFNVESAVVKITHDEQYNTYVAGTFEGIVDFDPGIKQYILTSSQDANSKQLFTALPDDIFFAKYNAAGKLIFAKDIGGTAGQSPVSISVSKDHSIYLVGTFEGNIDADPGADSIILYSKNNSSIKSYFIGKYDSLGNYIFAKPVFVSGDLHAFAIDKNNNIYIIGFFAYGFFDPENDTTKISVNGDYLYFAKYDANGKFIYLKSVGIKNGLQFGYDIAVNNKGNLVICGSIKGTQIDFDPGPNTYYADAGPNSSQFIASYTTNGGFIFESNGQSSNISSSSEAYLLRVDKNDNIIMEGYTIGTIKIDSRYDSVITTPYTYLYFMKYNKSGKPIFIKTLHADNAFQSLYFGSLAIDDYSNIYLTGNFYGTVDFDPGVDTVFVKSDQTMHSNNNLFLAKYDSAGNYNYVYNFAPTDSFFSRGAFTTDIYVDKKSEVTFAVNTNGKIDFYPGPDTMFYYPPFDVYPTLQYSFSFVLIKFKQTKTAKPYTIYASTSKADIDKMKTFSLNKLAKYLK